MEPVDVSENASVVVGEVLDLIGTRCVVSDCITSLFGGRFVQAGTAAVFADVVHAVRHAEGMPDEEAGGSPVG